ncbi:putative bifunctional diguanylate cyclase/phosphodiesterase [Rubrivivax sp. RP6-9]|uniref:putative bifunctional diguanylate cyclase/phosphodiesterase n=1 Tax=Rubrivivax sp. RP6-9 TaxID=3415750 RepID=UPI003CC50188
MRVHGLFLRSAVARRIFWALLAAALLPLVLVGSLAWGTLSERLDGQAQQVHQAMLKQIGLRLFDRLGAAQAALAAHAEQGLRPGHDPWLRPDAADGVARLALAALATADDDGVAAGGAPALVAAWRAARTGDGAPAGQRDLWWQARPGEAALVIVGHRDARGRGWWLAEIDPAFLWADFASGGAAAGMCVRDLAGRPLRCGDEAAAGAPSWNLFLHAGFGAPDWRLQGFSLAGGDLMARDVLGAWAAQGALLTLLLVASLSLVLVRRTLRPLDALIALARRFAAREWTARAAVPAGDEFGELASALHAMADRVGRQLQGMQVQAEVDNAILEGRDIGDVMRRVAGRLQELLPHAQVAVIARDPDGAAWRAHRVDAGAGPRDRPPPAVVLDAAVASAMPLDGLAVHCRSERGVPPWLRAALPDVPAAVDGLCWVPARWQDDLVALIVIASPRGLAADEDLLREVTELRDRVAVTLAAATRAHHLVERAVRDGLTGLLNSSGMHEACDRLLGARGAAAAFSMVCMDLDAFKEVNDSLGHAAGDELLRAVAQRLRGAAGPQALLARPGGDEFVVLLPGPPDAAAALAARLCQVVEQPFALRGQAVHVGASIGIASCPQHASDREELMRRADLAMYAAKAAGRGHWRFYDAALDARLAEKAWLVRELRLALDQGGLALHYQPRVDLHSRRVHSTEALVRWTHPAQGSIAPQRFIPVAEEAGLIEAVGAFVLDSALAQQRCWRDAGIDVGRVAVNVSPRQLRADGFALQVFSALATHGLRPADLELEITESLFVGDFDAVCARLAPLRDAGVVVALDDFGTGYSSLSVLHRLPVDVLKIDRSFVVELGQRASADAVARSIVALARALDKRVVAEGVETLEQEQHLAALGCDEVQGYLHARPLPPAALAERLRAGFAAPAAPEAAPV